MTLEDYAIFQKFGINAYDSDVDVHVLRDGEASTDNEHTDDDHHQGLSGSQD